MNTEQTPGKTMHDADAEIRREAARALGSARTPAKINAARAVAASRKGKPLSEEAKARQQEGRLAWAARRTAERQEQQGTIETQEKKPVGRPRKEKTNEATAEKRQRGRPKKAPISAEI